jgi:transaldolase
LWASTSTKNPAYPDVYYVEALIGPDTVNTMPPQTIVAYKDHGQPALRLEDNVDEARQTISHLEAVGIRMDTVTQQLETEGVASFNKSFDMLMKVVKEQCTATEA